MRQFLTKPFLDTIDLYGYIFEFHHTFIDDTIHFEHESFGLLTTSVNWIRRRIAFNANRWKPRGGCGAGGGDVMNI